MRHTWRSSNDFPWRQRSAHGRRAHRPSAFATKPVAWWLGTLLACAFATAAWISGRPLPAQEAAAPAGADAAATQPEADKDAFLRVVRNAEEEPTALETAITRYVPADDKLPGVAVDLIGAVHVADPEYYAALNKRFAEYDAVLYELVAPEGTRVPKGGAPPASGVALLQTGMTKALNLAFQLDHIDYTKANMVHADLSPKEFAQSMKDRGESFSQIFFRMMAHSMAQQSKPSSKGSDLQMLAALFSRDRDHQLKVILAEQFADMEGALDVFNGPDGSTLVTVRNTRAIEVLQRELRRGKKRVAIFYGAAHMPDMEKQLQEQLNVRRQDQQWIQAWNLTPPTDP